MCKPMRGLQALLFLRLFVLQGAGLETDGDVMLYQYHPPFAPSFLRRVEVLYNLK